MTMLGNFKSNHNSTLNHYDELPDRLYSLHQPAKDYVLGKFLNWKWWTQEQLTAVRSALEQLHNPEFDKSTTFTQLTLAGMYDQFRNDEGELTIEPDLTDAEFVRETCETWLADLEFGLTELDQAIKELK